MADSPHLIELLAGYLATTEPALRLLLSLLFAYVVILLHRKFLIGKAPYIQHLFFAITGVWLGYFNYGFSIIHAISCVCVLYITLVTCGGTTFSVGFSFVFHMSYLLAGYYFTGTDDYDIKWSMPQCVLTLKSIGTAFDVFDGQKEPSQLSRDQQKSALRQVPSFLEIAAHSFFPGSFLVGPQMSMMKYKEFVNGMYAEKGPWKKALTNANPSAIKSGFTRAFYGLSYMAIYQIGTLLIPDSYLLGNDFANLSIWKKLLLVGLWGKFSLYKYVSCWLLAEGVCIIAGLAYNGEDEEGKVKWDGCANVDLHIFETAYQFGHVIRSFNTNTNGWVSVYVYKRLKFLGNRHISQFSALMFLAVWHGLHSGYYICFFMEYVIMNLERDLENMLVGHPIKEFFSRTPYSWIKYVVMKIHVLVFFGFSLVGFNLLSFHRWWYVYGQLYYSGLFIYCGWLLYRPAVAYILKQTRRGSSNHVMESERKNE